MSEADLVAPIEGAITNAISPRDRLMDTESQEYSNLSAKEREYLGKLLTVFGPKSAPKDRFESFEPAVVVEDSTTLDNIKPALQEALSSGVDYWKTYLKAAKFSPTAEVQLALHERGLGFLNGERSDTRSYTEAVDQMASMASFYAEGQRDDRIDELYARENRKSPIWAGKLLYGKVGVLWNVGGSQITHYEEAFRSHIQRVKSIAVSNVPTS